MSESRHPGLDEDPNWVPVRRAELERLRRVDELARALVEEMEPIARRLDSQAAISTRPGQLEELEWIAAKVRVWRNALAGEVTG